MTAGEEDPWERFTLEEALFRLNDRVGQPVKIQLLVSQTEIHSLCVMTVSGTLRHWRERLPGYRAAEPETGIGYYALDEGDDTNPYIKTSINLSHLDLSTQARALDAMDRLDVEVAYGVWLSISRAPKEADE